MKRFTKTLAVAALAILPGAAQAQFTVPGQPTVPLGYCQLTNLSAAIALSACANGIPAGATMAVLQAETANIRYRDDGVAPTTSIGEIIVSGQQPMPYVGRLSALQFFSSTGILDVLFYK